MEQPGVEEGEEEAGTREGEETATTTTTTRRGLQSVRCLLRSWRKMHLRTSLVVGKRMADGEGPISEKGGEHAAPLCWTATSGTHSEITIM